MKRSYIQALQSWKLVLGCHDNDELDTFCTLIESLLYISEGSTAPHGTLLPSGVKG